MDKQQRKHLIMLIKVIFKNCVPLTNLISRTNSTQVGVGHDLDVVMLMYNFIEYSDNYWKTSRILWQYFRDKPALANNGDISDFNEDNATSSFDLKEKVTGQTGNNGNKKCLPLKYLRTFWRTLEMLFINCEINLNLN